MARAILLKFYMGKNVVDEYIDVVCAGTLKPMSSFFKVWFFCSKVPIFSYKTLFYFLKFFVKLISFWLEKVG